MTEPVSASLAAASAVTGILNSEPSKTAGRLLERVLGRSADAIGDALGRYTEYRLRNVGQVLEKAEGKARGRAGAPHPRVAHRILEEGSYAEDEVMAEYLSGVLAASMDEATDDRGVAWAAQVSDMSALQIRMHFILYREWATAALHSGLAVGQESERNKLEISIDLDEVLNVLDPCGTEQASATFAHVLGGLNRLGFVSTWGFGPVEASENEQISWDMEMFATMTASGMELYAWALGEPSLELHSFGELDQHVASVRVDRPKNVAFPRLSIPSEETSASQPVDSSGPSSLSSNTRS
ncbi:hypothetical protein [Leucobacter sp. gxy201]|uniref:hypothetical protein n=1 Tax=Leucobacter sp. gxy201 TaxID=2957200 RepID=UPI003DA0A9DC